MFLQKPETTSEQTRNNPISILVGLDSLRNATGRFFLDDGESFIQSDSYSEWSVFATSKNHLGIGEIRVDWVHSQYHPSVPELTWNNITLYGVEGPCTLVLLNDEKSMEFFYDRTSGVLVVPLNFSVYRESFFLYWGEAVVKQSLLERIVS